jgi:hypothetical protein
MAKVKINFGVSDSLREWIRAQPNIVDIVEESMTHIVVEHNMTGPEAQAMKSVFIDKLIEAVI